MKQRYITAALVLYLLTGCSNNQRTKPSAATNRHMTEPVRATTEWSQNETGISQTELADS